MNYRIGAAVGLTVLLFLGVQLGALALVEPFEAADYQAVEDPQDPTNSLLYFGVILVATAGILAAFRYGGQRLIRWLIVGVSAMLAWFVFAELFPPVASYAGVNLPAALAALGVAVALLVYPEWYVIDAAGVLMGAGAAGLFGISFGLLPALVLLVALAVYDAISVYRTKHMLTLAEGVMDLRIPVVLVVPTSLSYSYLAATEPPESLGAEGNDARNGERADPTETGGTDGAGEAEGAGLAEPVEANGAGSDEVSEADGGGSAEPVEANGGGSAEISEDSERDALFVGLGDAVIPTILVASAATFLEAPRIELPLVALNYPALGAMVGTLVGLLALLYMVLGGRAHAGLPLLNGGAIGGYLLGALASGIPIAVALGL